MSETIQALRALTVAQLKELAKRELGQGFSRFKTKAQLVDALAGLSAKKLSQLPGGAPRQDAREPRSGRQRPGQVKEPGSGQSGRPKALRPVKAVSPFAVPVGSGPVPSTPAVPPFAPEESRPLGGQATPTRRPFDLQPPDLGLQLAAFDEQLGELPDRYCDDSFVALPLDPETLFFYWDLAPSTVAAAALVLQSPRSVLVLWDERRQAVREVPCALESGSFYLSGLGPGGGYRGELFLVGSDGRRQRVGQPSNWIALNNRGLSPRIEDRFVRLTWGEPLGFWKASPAGRPGGGSVWVEGNRGGGSEGRLRAPAPTASDASHIR